MNPRTLKTTLGVKRLSVDEEYVLTHTSRWGADGYGAFVNKIGRGWHVHLCPKVFKTKKEAVAQWERYIQILLDRKAGRI